MATCPSCGVHGYEDDGTFTLGEMLWALPLGTWSLAGSQPKTAARMRPRLMCNHCGWYILGRVVPEDNQFIGDFETQHFPDSNPDRDPD